MDYLVLTQTGGILRPFGIVLGIIMNYIYRFLELFGISNIGLTIVLLTLVVNIILIPLTFRQQKFTRMNAVINPEIQKINKKYEGKNDERSLRMRQAETQAVYDKYGASPVGGCLPALIQIPILFALYRVIYNVPAYVEPVKQVYENIIKKLESSERNLYKIIFQDKLRSDAMESKIGEYMEMENEFEEMKAKLKYEGGRFLNNDRKDNEIIIIRTENTNLKNIIKKLEEKIQKNNELQLSKDRLINDLKEKIKSLEKNKIEIKNNINNSVREQLNLINGINININSGLNTKNKQKGKNNHHSNNNSLHSHKHISHISDESLSLKDRLNITEKKKGLTSKIKSIHFPKAKKSKEKEVEKKYEPFPMTRNKSFEKVKDDFLKRYFLKNSTIKGIKNINYKKPKQKQKQTYYRVNENKMNIANSSAYIPFFNNKKDLTNLFSIKKILMSGNRSSSAKRKRTTNNNSINYKSIF